ncbi:MAG: phosphotransferase [Chloroflexota bacterium]
MSLISKTIEHLKNPLYRNGYALIVSSAVTSVLGLLYWVLAARQYTAEAVGINSAMISTITLIAQIAQFNMINTLNRFVPSAGKNTKRLVLTAYSITFVLALVVSAIFLLTVNYWSPTLSFLRADSTLFIIFMLSAVGWGLFNLQDSILTGLRQATWVPIENLVFAIAKIGLLVLFATMLPQIGIFSSWMAPLIVLILAVNLLLFQRLIPQHEATAPESNEPFSMRQILQFSAGDYVASLVWTATVLILPIIVLEQAGAEANAYFYLAWQISYSLYLVSRNMGMSLITEGARDQSRLYELSYRTIVQTSRIMIPAVLVIVIFAPLGLSFFGPDYVTEGTAVLRLLALSAIPNIFNALYISIARVQRKIKSLLLILGSLGIIVLVSSYIMLGLYGIIGIAIAWLVCQTFLAVLLLLTELRPIWLNRLNVQPIVKLAGFVLRPFRRQNNQEQIELAESIFPQIRSQVPLVPGIAAPHQWIIQKLLKTVSDVTVLVLGPKGGRPSAMLKLPRTENGIKSLFGQKLALNELHSHPNLQEWRELLPRVLADGEVEGQKFFVEQIVPGVDSRDVFDTNERRRRIVTNAAMMMSQIHQNTASVVLVDDRLFDRWFAHRFGLLHEVYAQQTKVGSTEAALARLEARLRDNIVGKQLAVSWIHGDFSPGNILVSPDTLGVTGIIDWDLAEANILPHIDLYHLLLATRMMEQSLELGDVVRDLLQGGEWESHETAVLQAAQAALPGEAVDDDTLILLTWLWHVTSTLAKSAQYATHWLWGPKNLGQVIDSI